MYKYPKKKRVNKWIETAENIEDGYVGKLVNFCCHLIYISKFKAQAYLER